MVLSSLGFHKYVTGLMRDSIEYNLLNTQLQLIYSP